MADDPYDFEIEIPGKKKKASSLSFKSKHQQQPHHLNDDSSSDLDDMDSPSPVKPKKKSIPPNANATALFTQQAQALPSALDKAKNFLSKYSKQSTDLTKAEPRRYVQCTRMCLYDDEKSEPLVIFQYRYRYRYV
jgi:hypothetical protein